MLGASQGLDNGDLLLVLGLIAVGVFLAVFTASLLLARLNNPIQKRLARLRGETSPTSLVVKGGLRWPWLERRLLPAKQDERDALQRLLDQAGLRGEAALSGFLLSQPLTSLAMGAIAVAASVVLPAFDTLSALLLVGISIGVGFLLPAWWLRRRVAERLVQLRESFPDALDLLTVCVEAGLGLSAAIQRVADELMISHPLLGKELAIVNAEMRAGVDRAQALRNLAARTGLQDIRGLVALLIQTMRLGTSIGDALRVYSAEFRDRRLQLAEEQAAKIGTKLTFPLVLCLFPGFFIVAVGPAVIKIIGVFGALSH